MPSPKHRSPIRQQWNAWLDLTAPFKYLGIYQAIVADIENGRLQPGDSLPPQRTLAKLLGVDLTTVTKAYGMARDEGIIETRTGSGTCVAGESGIQPSAVTETALLDLSKNSPPRTEGQEINALIVKEMGRAFATIGDVASFNYQETGGNLRHRVAGATWLNQRMEHACAEQVILTSGAQSALFAICQLLTRTSKFLAVGQFCYPGIHTVARQLGLHLVPVRMDADGLIPEDFEEACQRHALTALYLVPNIDNPTTATLPQTRRARIVEIARRYNVSLIEDDPYYNIAANGQTSLAQLAPELTWHIATLSKCATPALRLAYLCAPDTRSAQEIAALMQAMTMMVSPLFAELASQWISNGILHDLTQAIRAENAARLHIAEQVFADLNFSAPPQGSHIWLHLPHPWQALDYAHQAERQQIKILPASSFSLVPDHRASESVRISLGAAADRQILAEGLQRLRAILDQPQAFYQAIV